MKSRKSFLDIITCNTSTRKHLTLPRPHKIELENQGTLKGFRKVSWPISKVVRQDFSERLVRRAFAELLLGDFIAKAHALPPLNESMRKGEIKSSA